MESRLAASSPVRISAVSGTGEAVTIRTVAPRLGNNFVHAATSSPSDLVSAPAVVDGYRRLYAARDYMAMSWLMPLKTRYGDDCGRGAAEVNSRDGRREDEQQRILAAERQRAQRDHRRERGRR